MSHSDDGHSLPPPHLPPPSAPVRSPVPEPTKVHHSHARLIAVVTAIVAVFAGTAIAYSSRSDDPKPLTNLPSVVASTAVATTSVAPPSTTTTVPEPTTTVDETAAACDEIAAVLGRLGSGPSTASGIADHLTQISNDVIDAALVLPATLRSDALELSEDIGDFAVTVEDLQSAREFSDESQTAAIDAVVAAVPPFSETIGEGSLLAEAYPALQEECRFDDDDPDVLLSHVLAMALPLDRFMATPLATDPRFWLLADIYDGVRSLVEAMSFDAESALHSHFAVCRVDEDASDVGDNEGCDGLAFFCNAGDMAACDDLYSVSVIDSEYEAIGAACGRRVEGTLGEVGGVIVGQSGQPLPGQCTGP